MTIIELLSAIGTATAIAISVLSYIGNRRLIAAQAASTFTQADSTNVKDALELKAEYKADMKDLRAELEIEHARAIEAEKKIEKMQAQIDADRILRDEAAKAMAEKLAALSAELEEYRECLGLAIGQLVDAGITPTKLPRGVIAPETKRKTAPGFGVR